mgnify:CR=1 FL=1
MAIALFNDQAVLAGQKLGISTAKAIALIIMAAVLPRCVKLWLATTSPC